MRKIKAMKWIKAKKSSFLVSKGEIFNLVFRVREQDEVITITSESIAHELFDFNNDWEINTKIQKEDYKKFIEELKIKKLCEITTEEGHLKIGLDDLTSKISVIQKDLKHSIDYQIDDYKEKKRSIDDILIPKQWEKTICFDNDAIEKDGYRNCQGSYFQIDELRDRISLENQTRINSNKGDFVISAIPIGIGSNKARKDIKNATHLRNYLSVKKPTYNDAIETLRKNGHCRLIEDAWPWRDPNKYIEFTLKRSQGLLINHSNWVKYLIPYSETGCNEKYLLDWLEITSE